MKKEDKNDILPYESKKVQKNGKCRKEVVLYRAVCKVEIKDFERTVRGYWSIENTHWHLDNQTIYP